MRLPRAIYDNYEGQGKMGESQMIAVRYRVEDVKRDLLGRGGMGDVYRATDTLTGETVAVKALNPGVLARDPGLLERFQREGEALRRLNHPNIVHSIAAFEQEGRHYLVMEYVGGGSLEGLLEKESRLPPTRAVEIGLDLGDSEGLAESLGGRGYTAWIMGEYEQAQNFHEEMLATCRETGDRRGTARAIADLAIDACGLKQFEQALSLWRESLAMYAEIGDRWGIADVLGDLGEGCNVLGRYAEAAQYAEQSLELTVKRRRGLADWELRVRAVAALGVGDARTAADYFCQALRSDLDTRYPARVLNTIAGVAALLAAKGASVRAFELLALVFHDHRTWQWAKDGAAPLLAELRAELPADIAAAAEARGRGRDLCATVEELLAELRAG